MKSEEIEKKLGKIISTEKGSWLEDAKYRADNRRWLKRSQAVAILVLKSLSSQGKNQKSLAEQMGVSPQLVNRWLRGKENFTFETIAKLEVALGIEIMTIADDQRDNEKVEIGEIGETGETGKSKPESLSISPHNIEYPYHADISLMAVEQETTYSKKKKKG